MTKTTKSTKLYKRYLAGKDTLDFLMVLTGIVGVMILFPDLAQALPAGPKDLKAAAKTVQDEIQGSGLSMAMNATGIAAIVYSAFNNFSKAPLISGGLILAFTNLFFPYVNNLVGIK